MKFEISPIAIVHNDRKDISDDFWGEVISTITLEDHIPLAAFDGLEGFSHIEVFFIFHKADPSEIVWDSAHPRENKAWPKAGVYAQRKKNRPNHIGATICEIIKKEGNTILVKKLDAIDGTPVIDIKPVLKEFLPQSPVHQPQWSSELMKDYWK